MKDFERNWKNRFSIKKSNVVKIENQEKKNILYSICECGKKIKKKFSVSAKLGKKIMKIWVQKDLRSKICFSSFWNPSPPRNVKKNQKVKFWTFPLFPYTEWTYISIMDSWVHKNNIIPLPFFQIRPSSKYLLKIHEKFQLSVIYRTWFHRMELFLGYSFHQLFLEN